MTTFQTIKDPASVQDYTITWTATLNGDTISSSSWTVDPGLTVDSDTNTTTTATVWVSGGTAGNYYRLTNTVVTANATPRTHVRSISVLCQQR